jgi:hypothetical protein
MSGCRNRLRESQRIVAAGRWIQRANDRLHERLGKFTLSFEAKHSVFPCPFRLWSLALGVYTNLATHDPATHTMGKCVIFAFPFRPAILRSAHLARIIWNVLKGSRSTIHSQSRLTSGLFPAYIAQPVRLLLCLDLWSSSLPSSRLLVMSRGYQRLDPEAQSNTLYPLRL